VLSRVLVIDESLNPRLAKELRNRGRHARPVQDLGLKGASDAELIRRVFGLYDDPVLVTADDFMPAEHAGVLLSVNATVATIRPWIESMALTDEWGGERRRNQGEWEEEIVHRWVHVMQIQRTGTTRRYGLAANAIWRRPRRRARASASARQGG
jgi:Domain of unknown function (DUF5615)